MKISVKYIDSTVYDIQVWQDYEPESPREWDNLGTMVCFHGKYKLGDDHNWETPEDFLNEEKPMDNAFILPLYLYDHSGITMKTAPFNDAWDSGQVGFIYVTIENAKKEFPSLKDFRKLKSQVYKHLEQEVKTYARYLEGNVYICKITEPSGQLVDSTGGLYDLEGVKEFINECIGDAEYNATGDLASYL